MMTNPLSASSMVSLSRLCVVAIMTVPLLMTSMMNSLREATTSFGGGATTLEAMMTTSGIPSAEQSLPASTSGGSSSTRRMYSGNVSPILPESSSSSSSFVPIVNQTSPFAYTFVIGGCGPEKPSYRNYIYNILVAAHILRQDGSTADVVVMVQMAADSVANELPAEEERWLAEAGVRIRYIPKADKKDSFYSVVQQKFRVAGLTEYERVLFLDADVMPLGSLDYLFVLSVRNVLKPNLIIPEHNGPANAGFFMFAPSESALSDIDDIIRRKERRDTDPENPSSWDVDVGWGHKIESPDKWERVDRWWFYADLRGARVSGTKWDFTSASADQGLLYHYAKYHRKEVSIVWAYTVENWGPSGPNGTVVLEETLDHPFDGCRAPMYRDLTGRFPTSKCFYLSPVGCHPPISDFEHMWGKEKPWLSGPPRDLSVRTFSKSTRHMWFYFLTVLNRRLRMGLDHKLSHWNDEESAPPPLGYSKQVFKPQRGDVTSSLQGATTQSRR